MNKRSMFVISGLAIVGALASFVFLVSPTQAAPCHTYTSSSPLPPTGYAVAWDVFSAAKDLLLKVDCGTSTTFNVGYGNTSQIIYKTGYIYKGSWQAVPLTGSQVYTGSDGTQYSDWLVGSASATISPQAGTNYVVAFVCTPQAGQWKCGCRDTTCAVPAWQLQAFSTGGISDGGGTFPANPRGDCNAPGAFDRSHCYSTPVCFLVDDSLDDELRGSGSQCYLTGGDGLGGTTCTALGKKKCCTSGGATYCEACYRNPGGRGRSPVRCERISGT